MVTLFLMLAFVCFLIAFLSVPVPRVNVLALGLAFWVLVPLGQTLGWY